MIEAGIFVFVFLFLRNEYPMGLYPALCYAALMPIFWGYLWWEHRERR